MAKHQGARAEAECAIEISPQYAMEHGLRERSGGDSLSCVASRLLPLSVFGTYAGNSRFGAPRFQMTFLAKRFQCEKLLAEARQQLL